MTYTFCKQKTLKKIARPKRVSRGAPIEIGRTQNNKRVSSPQNRFAAVRNALARGNEQAARRTLERALPDYTTQDWSDAAEIYAEHGHDAMSQLCRNVAETKITFLKNQLQKYSKPHWQRVDYDIHETINQQIKDVVNDLSSGYTDSRIIYVATQNGHPKIGTTKKCPLIRTRGIGGPDPTQLVAFGYAQNGAAIESAIKKELKSFRRRGEWFDVQPKRLIKEMLSYGVSEVIIVGKYKTWGD